MPKVHMAIRKPIKHKMGDTTFYANHTRELGYSLHGKDAIKNTRGLLTAFYKMSNEKLSYYKDPNGRFSIRLENPRAGFNTNKAYIVNVGSKAYFVKEINDDSKMPGYSFKIKYESGRDGVSEHKAIELLKQFGINVIPVHLSYVNPIDKKSFVVYEFSKLKTADELLRENKITAVKYKNIQKKLIEIEEHINREFHKFDLVKYSKLYDLDTDNVFYSLKENKFYIFDPILLKKGSTHKYDKRLYFL